MRERAKRQRQKEKRKNGSSVERLALSGHENFESIFTPTFFRGNLLYNGCSATTYCSVPKLLMSNCEREEQFSCAPPSSEHKRETSLLLLVQNNAC